MAGSRRSWSTTTCTYNNRSELIPTGAGAGLRGSTLHEYRKIGDRLAARPRQAGGSWAGRALDAFTAEDLLAVRRELIAANRSADTVNHYRRVVRGIFGTHPSSPALAWEWMAHKAESEGKLQF
jgi:hypothetical protein